jgi:hypothetical protein
MTINAQSHASRILDKVKHLFLANPIRSGLEYSPFFYAEARIDFNDVRTGLRETFSLSKALEIYSNDAQLLWADDMIHDVDPKQLNSSAPEFAQLRNLPDFVDVDFIKRMETQFIQYLLRSFETRVYRNFALNIYSFSNESLGEFTSRCTELLESSRRHDLDSLHEVCTRKLEQLKQKYLRGDESAQSPQNHHLFSRASERIAGLFMFAEMGGDSVLEPLGKSGALGELHERLLTLESETRKTIAKLRDSYGEKALAIDEYILHANLKDIHFVRSGILWMPVAAARH